MVVKKTFTRKNITNHLIHISILNSYKTYKHIRSVKNLKTYNKYQHRKQLLTNPQDLLLL